MPGTGISSFLAFYCLIFTATCDGLGTVITLISKRRQQSLREGTLVARGHTAGKRQSQDSNPGVSDSEELISALSGLAEASWSFCSMLKNGQGVCVRVCVKVALAWVLLQRGREVCSQARGDPQPGLALSVSRYLLPCLQLPLPQAPCRP